MAPRRTTRDYEDDVTAASRVGLAELMTTLGTYRDALVLIGGWAPYLILESFGEPGAFQEGAFQDDAFQTKFVHVGSIDIDLVVDPAIIDIERYATIVEALLARGWEPVGGSLFQFEKRTRLPDSRRLPQPQSSHGRGTHPSPPRGPARSPSADAGRCRGRPRPLVLVRARRAPARRGPPRERA